MAYVNKNKTLPILRKGDKGDKGDNGDSAFIRYSANADGTDFTEEWSEGQAYIGFATGQTAPTDKNDYEWVSLGVSEAKKEADRAEAAADQVEEMLQEYIAEVDALIGGGDS